MSFIIVLIIFLNVYFIIYIGVNKQFNNIIDIKYFKL